MLKLSGSHYVTDNSYVPKIYGIWWTIFSFLTHEDEGIRSIATKMKLKHDKYWSNVNNIHVYCSLPWFLIQGTR